MCRAWFLAALVLDCPQLFGALNEIEVAPGVAIQTGASLDTPPIARAMEHSDNADPDARDGKLPCVRVTR